MEKGDLGDEDDVGGGADPRVEGDPAGVAPHHLDDHDALVALGGGVELVDRVGGGLDRGIEAEGDVGGGEVVVDGLGDADDAEAFLGQFVGDAEGAIAADGDEGVEPVVVEGGDDLVGPVAGDDGAVGLAFGPLEGVAAVGGAEDGAAEVGDAADALAVEADGRFAGEEAVVAFADAVDLPALVEGGEHDGADDGVEARGVAAAGVDGDASNRVFHFLR